MANYGRAKYRAKNTLILFASLKTDLSVFIHQYT
jgi:hypothetical protein